MMLQPRMLDDIEHLHTAPFEVNLRKFFEPEVFPTGNKAPALRELGFSPCLMATHARHSDLHQMADVVAGVVREFMSFNIQHASDLGELPSPTYRDGNLATVMPCFRGFPSHLWSHGMGLWPQNLPRSHYLKQRVESLVRP